ncbi:MAG TPA: substrate-binding domain-containing protein [Candidatus Saccharimonadales bacterium]|nr:substrate-binding domain-containing protein [Candidatus Saccharimonadales bacterium]
MSLPEVLLSLPTDDNDYQRAQAETAKSAARAHGMRIEIQYAENDAVLQVQQILKALQQKDQRYAAIIAEPVGTSMEQAARLASASGVAWGILNHETTYISALRRSSKSALFEVTNNHYEIGRIEGQQVAALLPQGGVALYIEGPSTGGAARLRTEGMMAAKPSNVELKILKGDWTQANTRRSVANWLGIRTSRSLGVAAVICQNDAMALGVREAFESTLSGAERETWLELPMTGCDGLPSGGQELVKRKILTATIIVPPNAGVALELLAKCFRGEPIPEKTVGVVSSYPEIEKLRQRRARAASSIF